MVKPFDVPSIIVSSRNSAFLRKSIFPSTLLSTTHYQFKPSTSTPVNPLANERETIKHHRDPSLSVKLKWHIIESAIGKSAWKNSIHKKNLVLCVWFVDFSCCAEFSRRTRELSSVRGARKATSTSFNRKQISIPSKLPKTVDYLEHVCRNDDVLMSSNRKGKAIFGEMLLSAWRLMIRTNPTSFYFPIKNQLRRATAKTCQMCFERCKNIFSLSTATIS
jgi:hypothetical protein